MPANAKVAGMARSYSWVWRKSCRQSPRLSQGITKDWTVPAIGFGRAAQPCIVIRVLERKSLRAGCCLGQRSDQA